MKSIVIYYSSSGNNRYLAGRIAGALQCEIEGIRPRLGVFPVLLLFSLLKVSAGIKALRHRIEEYDVVILCGPIWMGQLVSPLRDFLTKYCTKINKLVFMTCCAGGDAEKDSKFGYETVFTRIRNIIGNKGVFYGAVPVLLVVPEEQQKEANTVLKTRLTDNNMTPAFTKRLNTFIEKIKEQLAG